MKCEITYRFSKNLESTYEGVQSRKVATGFQPATLLKIQVNSCNSNPHGSQNLFELHEFSNYRSSSFFRPILVKKARGCIVQTKEEDKFFFYEKYLFCC